MNSLFQIEVLKCWPDTTFVFVNLSTLVLCYEKKSLKFIRRIYIYIYGKTVGQQTSNPESVYLVLSRCMSQGSLGLISCNFEAKC